MDLIELSRVGNDFYRHPWEQARARAVAFLLQKKQTASRHILDVGSGDAFIAGSLARTYPQSKVTAVDIHYTAEHLDKIKPPPNLELVSNLNDVSTDPAIDTVLLMDVLEHVERPGELLQQIRLLPVHKDTDFFITVPAYQSLFTQHDVTLGHFKRYNRRSLHHLVQANGFEVLQSGYFFQSLLPVRVWQKIFHKEMTGDGLHNWHGGRFTTGLLSAVFSTEFKISWYLSRFGIHLPGLTCFCLCRPLPS